MTREEAHRILSNGLANAPSEHEWCVAFEMAIKALEQEPCDDYISRQTAIDCVTYDEEYTVECLKKLPPVTPPTNIGWWIDEKVDGGRKVYCSKCNGSAVFEYVNDGDIYSSYGHGVVKKTKYCPNCGTKMLELNNVDWSKYTLQNVKERDSNDT